MQFAVSAISAYLLLVDVRQGFAVAGRGWTRAS